MRNAVAGNSNSKTAERAKGQHLDLGPGLVWPPEAHIPQHVWTECWWVPYSECIWMNYSRQSPRFCLDFSTLLPGLPLRFESAWMKRPGFGGMNCMQKIVLHRWVKSPGAFIEVLSPLLPAFLPCCPVALYPWWQRTDLTLIGPYSGPRSHHKGLITKNQLWALLFLFFNPFGFHKPLQSGFWKWVYTGWSGFKLF